MSQKLMNIMDDIMYGYMDRNKNIHTKIDKHFSKLYCLQSPEELQKNKYGVCWDQVEFERLYFETNNVKVKTYFFAHYDNNKCPTHTILVFKENNKYYYFEHSWERFRGIYGYNSLEELLLDVKNKFIKYELNNNCNMNCFVIYEYSKPEYGIGVLDFYKHCEKGKKIKIS